MAERIEVERAVRKRRIWRTLLVLFVILAAVFVFGNRFYHTVQAPRWDVLGRAAEKAKESAGLSAVEAVERFVGDRPYSIVYGTDGEGEPVIVWLWDEDGMHVERQDAGISRDEAAEAALAERPEAKLLRVTAGKLHGEYVWEVFTEVREPGGTRKYYDYYRFRDGRKLETYRLALER